ncbi:MAG: DUF3307 domain-containing protein, partial [Bacillota bacterium]
HSILYSIPALISLLFVEGSNYLTWIAIMCGAHFVVDFIKFFIKPVYYSPKADKEVKGFHNHVLKVDIRYFADQFLHLVIITSISIWFLQNNPDIGMNSSIFNELHIKHEILIKLFQAAAAFIIVLQPVSLTFYKIFNIDVLAIAKTPQHQDDTNNPPVDIKGTGAIIGFMERIIMLCLLIMGEYTAIGFVIAGKSIIRFNSNVKQEFFIIGTFYGIITTIVPYILFFQM